MNIQDKCELSDSAEFDESEYELLHHSDAEISEKEPPYSIRNWNWKNLIILAFLWTEYFLCNVAYSNISPFFPREAERHGVSTIMIGVIISSSPLSVAIISLFVGYALSRWSVWPIVFTGLMLVGSSFTALGFVNYIPATSSWIFVLTCIFLRLIEGIGTAMFMTAAFSTIPQLFPNSVSTVMGVFEVAGGIGYGCGPMLGGVFYQYGGFRLPFLTVGCSVLLFVVPCTLMVRNMRVDESEKESLPFKIIFQCYTDLTFISLCLLFVFVYNIMGVYAPSLQQFLTNEFHQNAVQVGTIYFITYLSYAIFAFFVGPLSERIGRRSFIILGVVMAVLCHFIIGLQFILDILNLWFLRCGLLIGGIACAFCSVPIYSELLKITKRYKRENDSEAQMAAIVSGSITSSISIGQFMWPLLGGLLANFYSIPWIAIIASEIILAEALLLIGVTIIDKYI